jgi:hypothetical protein
MTQQVYESVKADAALWERQLVVLRHIVRGRWDKLRDMSLDQLGDDDSFCRFVFGQHLHLFVFGRITASGHEDLFPLRWLAELRTEVTRFEPARRQLRSRLAEMAAGLASAGVDFRILKGVPFAKKYLGDINLRRSTDIDLLVRERDIDRTLGILYALGYRDTSGFVRMTANGPAIKRDLVKPKHEMDLELDGIRIDLHWRLRTAPGYRWRDAQIWAAKQEVCVEGVNYPVLSDEYALVLLLVSIAHDIARGGCRLKHLLDLYQLLLYSEQNIAWPEFLERRRSENNLRIAVNVLHMVVRLWEAEQELPSLAAALAPHASLQSTAFDESRTLDLIRAPRSGIENKLWFAEVYGVRLRRDLAWMIVQTIPHPKRWPIVIVRFIQFASKQIARTTKHALARVRALAPK